jgi:hypothetical protein
LAEADAVTKLPSRPTAPGPRGKSRVDPAHKRKTMLIGELALLGGASVQAIRLYERKGLLREPDRTASGYRVYQPLDLEILKAVKRCRSLGLTLAETRRVTRILERTGGMTVRSLRSRTVCASKRSSR